MNPSASELHKRAQTHPDPQAEYIRLMLEHGYIKKADPNEPISRWEYARRQGMMLESAQTLGFEDGPDDLDLPADAEWIETFEEFRKVLHSKRST